MDIVQYEPQDTQGRLLMPAYLAELGEINKAFPHATVTKLLADAEISRVLLTQATAVLAKLERPVPCSDPGILSPGETCAGHCLFCGIADAGYRPHVHDLDCPWLLAHNSLTAAGITPDSSSSSSSSSTQEPEP